MIDQFRLSLQSKSNVSKEHRDFILIRDLYHCSPSELEQQEEAILDLHYKMLIEEWYAQKREEKLNNQKNKVKALLNQ